MSKTTPGCANEDHPDRPAAVRMEWPDGRFIPGFACRSCLRDAISYYVTGDEDGERHAVLIKPLEATDG